MNIDIIDIILTLSLTETETDNDVEDETSSYEKEIDYPEEDYYSIKRNENY